MTITVNTLTETEYNTLRYEWIKEFEESGHENSTVYNDGKGWPTMGVGFNLTQEFALKAVLKFGFDIKSSDLANAYKVMSSAVTKATGKNKTNKDMQDILNKAWQTYQQDSNAVFEIDTPVDQSDNNKIYDIFNNIAEEVFELKLNNRITGKDGIGVAQGSIDRSTERVALFSLIYGETTGKELVGPKLLAAIKAGDRFEAFYQIRYESNKNQETGVAKRRYAEAALLGVFSTDIANQTEAKQAVDGFIANLTKIQDSEDQFASKYIDEANKNLQKITSISLTVNTVGELLKPATGYILERFNPENSTIDLTQFTHTIDGDVLLGIINKQTGEIASVNLNIAGKDKNDLLIAVENKANTLNGGLGDDVLIGNAGIDKLIGGDGTDTLLGGAGIDVLIGGEGDDYLDGGTGSDTMSGGKGNDTYIVDNAGDVIIEKDGEGNADKIISSVSFTLSSLQKNNIEILQLAEPEQTTQQANASAPSFLLSKEDVFYFNDKRMQGDNFLNKFNRINALAAVNNQSVLTLTGNEFDNTLIGNSLDNILLGGGGADTLYGGAGDDHLESGDEDVYGNGDINILQGGAGNDTLVGGDGIDLLYGGTGDDILFVDRGGFYVTEPAEGFYATKGKYLGTEYMNGGVGFDTYYIGTASNNAIIVDSDGKGEVYINANNIGDKTYRLKGGGFQLAQTTDKGLEADGYIQINADGTSSSFTLAYELDGSQTLIAYGFNIPNFYNGMLGINLEGGRVDTGKNVVEDVLEKITFDEQFDPIEVERIKTAIKNAYEQSATARKMLKEYAVIGGNDIKINFSENGFSSLALGRESSTDIGQQGNTAIAIDLNWLDNNTYISTNGKAVADTLETALIHELVHLMTGLTDTDNAGEKGETIAFANTIYREMGLPEQASYLAYDSTGNTLIANFEYTQGQAIDRAVILRSENLAVNDFDGSTSGNVDYLIIGNERANKLVSGAGDDFLYGGDGNDILNGNQGNDTINGGSGDDKIDGGTGDDNITGGLGNDILNGSFGYNRYFFSQGDGQDIIGDDIRYTGGREDELVFTSGINPDDVVLTHNGTDLVISFVEGEDQITIKDFFDSYYSIQQFGHITFANGTQWSNTDIQAMLLQGTEGDDEIIGDFYSNAIDGLAGNDVIKGGTGDDVISGGLGSDDLFGEKGNDTLFGGDGDDTLNGGEGDDILTGGKGNDIIETGGGVNTINFARGDGQDVISSQYQLNIRKRVNTLVFADDIAKTDVTLSRVSGDLVIKINGSSDQITVEGYFNYSDDTLKSVLSEIVFADGTLLSAEDIHLLVIQGTDADDKWLVGNSQNDVISGGLGDDVIKGYIGDDILTGGQGNDIINGGSGSDTYIYSAGDGQDIYQDTEYYTSSIDTLSFTDINSTDVRIRQNGDDLIITFIDNDSDQIIIKNQFKTGRDDSEIEHFSFADGVVWQTSDLIEQSLKGSAANDIIYGFDRADTINAGLGDDIIYGLQGDDVIYGEGGNDILEGGAGNDQLFGGDGNDTLKAGDGADILDGGAGDDILISFDDIYDTSGKTLIGGAGNDILYGSFGDDTYQFNLGDGQDRIIETRQEQAYSNFTASNDTLVFGEGITASDLTFERHGDDMLIKVASGGDSITIENWFKSYTEHFLVNNFQFNDGTSLTVAEINGLVVQLGTNDGEQLVGSANDDRLSGLGGDDQLFGQAGNDTLLGGNGDDYIDGGSGKDYLVGGTGNDRLRGNKGDDTLIGGAGDDAYMIYAGDGHDILDVSDGGQDKLYLQDINKAQLLFSRDGDDLLISVDGGVSQSIRVVNHFLGGESALDYINTADGSWLNTNDINLLVNAEPIPDPEPDPDPIPEPTPDPVPEPSVGGDDVIVGTANNDIIVGGAGNNTLTGGKGDDLLLGGAGNDVFIFAKGDGRDVIEVSTGTNVIEFSSDISWQDVAYNLSKFGDDLILKIAGGPDQITIKDFFIYGSNVLSDIKFSDGSNLTPAQIFGAYGLPIADAIPETTPEVIFGDLSDNTLNGTNANDILNGQSGNDTLIGGLGNDTLIGGLGDDTYVLSRGDGQDTIDATGGGVDTVLFKTGISFNDIASSLMKSGNDLILGSGDSQVTITNFFLGGDYAVDRFVFEEGGQLVAAQIFGAYGLSVPTIAESDQNINLPDQRQFVDIIQGNDSAQGLFGSSDDELLLGAGGDDVLAGGRGNDTLMGGAGNDNYLFAVGDGQDIINNYDTSTTNLDVLSFGAGILSSEVSMSRFDDDLIIQIMGTDDQVTIQGYFINNGDSDYALSSIVFEDGTSWNIDNVKQLLVVGTNNMTVGPLPIDNGYLDFSLNLFVQAYVTLDDDNDTELGKVKTSYLTSLSTVEY